MKKVQSRLLQKFQIMLMRKINKEWARRDEKHARAAKVQIETEGRELTLIRTKGESGKRSMKNT